jgi:hypothetical protein
MISRVMHAQRSVNDVFLKQYDGTSHIISDTTGGRKEVDYTAYKRRRGREHPVAAGYVALS